MLQFYFYNVEAKMCFRRLNLKMRSTALKPAGYTYARQLHIADVIQMCNDLLINSLSFDLV